MIFTTALVGDAAIIIASRPGFRTVFSGQQFPALRVAKKR
jgi:hypothetical protein